MQLNVAINKVFFSLDGCLDNATRNKISLFLLWIKATCDLKTRWSWLGFNLSSDWQTPVEDVPLAIAPFQGRVLVGVGKLLRIYDLGKKKLLRKCENKVRSQKALSQWKQVDGLQHLMINVDDTLLLYSHFLMHNHIKSTATEAYTTMLYSYHMVAVYMDGNYRVFLKW